MDCIILGCLNLTSLREEFFEEFGLSLVSFSEKMGKISTIRTVPRFSNK